jgi:hypothetical protein
MVYIEVSNVSRGKDLVSSFITNLNINHQMFLVQFDEKCRNINIIIIIQQIGEVGAQCTLQNGVLAWCHSRGKDLVSSFIEDIREG